MSQDFHDARMADAPTGGNDHAIALIKHYVDTGKAFPFSLTNSFYMYADDYFRLKKSAETGVDIPLRKRAAGQYYLNDDKHPDRRILPYSGDPLMRIGEGDKNGYWCTCTIESMEQARRRQGNPNHERC
jgi:hypothetical protein